MKFLKRLASHLGLSSDDAKEFKNWTEAEGGLEGVDEGLRALFKQQDSLARLNEMKARRQPAIDVDYLRALHFWRLGQMSALNESLKEELRYFPDNPRAKRLQQKLSGRRPKQDSTVTDPFWQHIYQTVTPYTMMGEARLNNIYQQTTRLCEKGVAGNFVECGVAAGGSSALLAAVIKKHGQQECRRVLSFDTFEGMPDPTEEDVHQGIHAQETGWGAGTCSASETSLMEVCAKLDVAHLVTPVKGLFADTLPCRVGQLAPVAFLHVDGDWYSSTKDVLENVYDSVVPGGVIQFDDYGYWDGCRKAVHEFFESRGLGPELHKIDSTGVWMIKT